MSESAARIVLGHVDYTNRLSYFDDWLDAFQKDVKFHVDKFNFAASGQEAVVRHKLLNCDAVVLLHSTNGDTTEYLEPYARCLADRRVPLITFVGNEVNLPGSPIAEKRRIFSILRPDWVATQLLQDAGEYLFGDVAKRGVISVPHALNPTIFHSKVDSHQRPIDIGTRGARYLPHLGDNDRNRICDFFSAIAQQKKLVVEISDTRTSRLDWMLFLNRCKGTVSTESGSWYLERDDAVANAIRAFVLDREGGVMISNDSWLRKWGHRMPQWARSSLRQLLKLGPVRHEALVNEKIPYDEIHSLFFSGRQPAPVYGKCISSRHFDAIGTKTCQIMFPGRFNDILVPDLHYLALAPDFSNIGEVLCRFSDPEERLSITETAHAHVLNGHTYAHRTKKIYSVLFDAAVS